MPGAGELGAVSPDPPDMGPDAIGEANVLALASRIAEKRRHSTSTRVPGKPEHLPLLLPGEGNASEERGQLEPFGLPAFEARLRDVRSEQGKGDHPCHVGVGDPLVRGQPEGRVELPRIDRPAPAMGVHERIDQDLVEGDRGLVGPKVGWRVDELPAAKANNSPSLLVTWESQGSTPDQAITRRR